MDMNLVINAIKAEMKPSMGCTEPVALALAVSRTCEHLDAPTQKLEMLISSNIFKNAYSVQIPNAGTYGIELACVLGMLLSKPGNTMEICAGIKPEHVEKAKKLVAEGFVHVKVLKSSQFYIECTATDGKDTVHTITEDEHDNLVFCEKNGEVLLDKRVKKEAVESEEKEGTFDVTKHTFSEFYNWANEVDVADLQFIKEAIDINMEIAKKGMEKKYAFGVGPTVQNLLEKGMLKVCGAMLAGTGSAAGMVYMMGGTAAQVSGAVQNMMGSVAGIFCDGAKGGCAVKVAACASEAVYAAMYAMDGSVIGVSDGINSTKAEDTAKNLAKLSHEALDTLDMKVIEIMQTKK